MEAEFSATRYAEVPVADLAGLNMQLTSCYFAATPDSTRSCNASRPTTRPGEEDLSDLMYRRTEENSQPMTRRNPADPRGAVAARSPCLRDQQNSEGGGHGRGHAHNQGEQQDRSKVGNTRLTALSRMSCPPAEPVQLLFDLTASPESPAHLGAPWAVCATRRCGQTLGPSAWRTWVAWPSALTLCQARSMRPCSSTKNVERSTPMLVRPYR